MLTDMTLPSPVPRHKTAIVRHSHSRPVARALEDAVLRPDLSFFDYGCGRGADVRLLRERGYQGTGWDPEYAPVEPKVTADVVNLGYVINVIEDPKERAATLREAFALAKRTLVVSAQTSYSDSGTSAQSFGDGVVTRRGTFQKYFSQQELRDFIEATLGLDAFPASLGIFYVFRDESERQALILRQVLRRPLREPRTLPSLEDRLAPHRELLQAFSRQVEALGRIPRPAEFPELPELRARVGSPGRCIKLCEKLLPGFSFAEARRLRSDDLLVYIALSRFRRRPRFGDLPETLQWDIRDIFGSYQRACELGDDLLFRVGKPDVVNQACSTARIGKLLPDDLYVHASAVDRLDPVLRVYVGCGRAALGDVEGANVVKIHRHSGKLSYLCYSTFERDPHPPLAHAVRINLRTREVTVREYSGADNPPILHRKETLLPQDHPLWEKFAALTRQEEAAGLLQSGRPIGFSREWKALLEEGGYFLSGHRLCRRRAK